MYLYIRSIMYLFKFAWSTEGAVGCTPMHRLYRYVLPWWPLFNPSCSSKDQDYHFSTLNSFFSVWWPKYGILVSWKKTFQVPRPSKPFLRPKLYLRTLVAQTYQNKRGMSALSPGCRVKLLRIALLCANKTKLWKIM